MSFVTPSAYLDNPAHMSPALIIIVPHDEWDFDSEARFCPRLTLSILPEIMDAHRLPRPRNISRYVQSLVCVPAFRLNERSSPTPTPRLSTLP